MNFSCVNRVELDRQHLADIDLMVAVGGDGTVLSAAHFLDHGTIPLLGINSDPNVSTEDRRVTEKKVDERRYVVFCSPTSTVILCRIQDEDVFQFSLSKCKSFDLAVLIAHAVLFL